MVNNAFNLNGRFVTPDVVVSHFHLRPGDVVADFGAGRGQFAELVSKVVGPTGKVYACEIQKNLVDTIAENMRRLAITNVDAVWSDIEAKEGSKLQGESIDVALLINTLFQMEDKASAIEEIRRVLRPGGRLYLIDWTDSFSGMGPQPENVLVEPEAIALLEQGRFVLENSFDAGDHHYGLVFRRP